MDYEIQFTDESKNNIRPSEWILSNGIGGYAGLSISGECCRKHHALLIASKRPPTNRVVLLTKIEERIRLKDQVFSLVSQSYQNHIEQSTLQTHFVMNDIPEYRYANDFFTLKKRIAPKYGKNMIAITYELESFSEPIELCLTPLFNYRAHSEVSIKEDLAFTQTLDGKRLHLRRSKQEEIYFSISEGTYLRNTDVYSLPFAFSIDRSTGDDRQDTNFQPYRISIEMPPHSKKEIEILCSDNPFKDLCAFDIISQYQKRLSQIVSKTSISCGSPFLSESAKRLVMSGDQFIVDRKSTNAKTVLAGFPWFTDWGRDTMIAFEGLLLTTKRFVEAKDVLSSFSKYAKNGLIPNMFPDEGSEPLYNTADASLWYIHAIYQYYQATKDLESINDLLYPVMESIIYHYQFGTDFNIYMDSDCLIHAGSGMDQITWMDVRINGEVITPRHGKPVEINALWYNALCIMDFFEQLNAHPNPLYSSLAQRVKESFVSRFWNEERRCLLDVVDEDDPSIRPNQLYAISLPFSMIDVEMANQILTVVEADLLDVYGIRTLSKFDPRYISEYSGDIVKRDHAYHMGTSWGFLMGTYLYCILKVHSFSEVAKQIVTMKLNDILKTLDEGCIHSYAEIFDGTNGTLSKGCFSQAWSVAEMLRVLEKL